MNMRDTESDNENLDKLFEEIDAITFFERDLFTKSEEFPEKYERFESFLNIVNHIKENQRYRYFTEECSAQFMDEYTKQLSSLSVKEYLSKQPDAIAFSMHQITMEKQTVPIELFKDKYGIPRPKLGIRKLNR
jgi:DNA repair ATPase RecN